MEVRPNPAAKALYESNKTNLTHSVRTNLSHHPSIGHGVKAVDAVLEVLRDILGVGYLTLIGVTNRLGFGRVITRGCNHGIDRSFGRGRISGTWTKAGFLRRIGLLEFLLCYNQLDLELFFLLPGLQQHPRHRGDDCDQHDADSRYPHPFV